MTEFLGRLLGYDNVSAIESIRPSFGAEWAHSGPAWVIFGCMGLIALSIAFYSRFQHKGSKRARMLLAVARSALLCILLLILADPILEISLTSEPKPLFWVLFDGTDSMAISDEYPEDELKKYNDSTEIKKLSSSESTADSSDEPKSNSDEESIQQLESTQPSRADYIKALLQSQDSKLLSELNERFRLRAYRFDSPDGVVAVPLAGEDSVADEVDSEFVLSQLTTDGQVTAIGNAFDDLVRRHATQNLAGALVVSDFDQNAGSAPLNSATKLGVPIFTLGVGATTAVDLSVDMQTSLKMKKAESTSINVTLRQQELDGEAVSVRVVAYPAGTAEEDIEVVSLPVGEQTLILNSPTIPVEFPFTPKQTGRFVFAAEVDKAGGEIVVQNNRVEREVTIIDDFMRLLYVEYEPTWEWRFVKEVFHRDSLVGMRGFRTYLRSSDPSVRETNDLFLPSLTLPRSQFFEYDVIFLGDMPAATLSTRFCEMTKEFVSQFGGGLVVMAGPRFGPGELANTPLADMLPVVVDPDARLRDNREFSLQLSPMANQYDFMRLGVNDQENAKAWKNLGRMPWYQPVKRLEPRASTVLAQHPTHTCADGKTPQPLIAVRKYGRGEVIYIAHNEMWRLRRKYGELYYRQFWGQLIHRLGLSHALGSQKRFVVRTDRQQYQADDKVLITVEAYNEDFDPLTEDDLPQKYLSAEVIEPGRREDGEANVQALNITQFRPGVFEARLPVYKGGEYRVLVTDPVTDEVSDVHFQVTSLSAERRSAVRNLSVQQNIAAETNAKSYELDTALQLLDDFNPPRPTETTVEVISLWNTWLCFFTLVGLLMAEWFCRKLVNLV